MEKKTTRQKMTPECHMQNPVCLHVEKNRIQTPKICVRDYECWHCGFDQWLEEMEMVQT